MEGLSHLVDKVQLPSTNQFDHILGAFKSQS